MKRTKADSPSRGLGAAAVTILAAAVALAAGCSGGSGGAAGAPYPVETAVDIPYAGDDDSRHKLDVYTPVGTAHPKVVFFVPGGAWRQGDKSQYGELGATLAGYYRYTTVVTNYRLSNPDDGQAVFPDHIEDVAKAFAWVKSHISEMGGSPDHLYVFGQSAGAHLASLLATDGSRLEAEGCSLADIRGVISMSGVYNLGDLVRFPLNPLDLGAEDVTMYKAIALNAFGGWDPATLVPASPVTFIHDSQPPFLLVTVEQDMPGFGKEGEIFEKSVSDLGGPDVSLDTLVRSDFSDETWEMAAELAAAEPMLADYVGHYAEVVAINTKEHESRSTRLVVDFIESHEAASPGSGS